MSDNNNENKVDKATPKSNFFRERANKSFKHFALKYQNTRFAQNVDSL